MQFLDALPQTVELESLEAQVSSFKQILERILITAKIEDHCTRKITW